MDDGTWTSIDSSLTDISVAVDTDGAKRIWGIDENDQIFYRSFP